MSLRKFLITLAVSTVFCWLAWVIVIMYINPQTAGSVGLFCFYMSLFVGLVGTLSLVGFFVRFFINKHEAPFRFLGISLRQGALLSLLVVGGLLLQGAHVLVWWSILLLIVGLVLLETFFLTTSGQTNKIRKHHGR